MLPCITLLHSMLFSFASCRVRIWTEAEPAAVCHAHECRIPGICVCCKKLSHSSRPCLRYALVRMPLYHDPLPARMQKTKPARVEAHFCHGIPNPETPHFSVQQYLDHIKDGPVENLHTECIRYTELPTRFRVWYTIWKKECGVQLSGAGPGRFDF